MIENDNVISEYFRTLGRKGGKSKSTKKIEAAHINIKKATETRIKNKQKINIPNPIDNTNGL